MDSAPPLAGNLPPDPQKMVLSQDEAMHIQEIHRANMTRRAFHKKLEKKAADWRMHEDFLTSTRLEGNERLQAERRYAEAEREFIKVLVARERGAEGPYRHSLHNYRSWQESHPPQAAPPSSGSSPDVVAPPSDSNQHRRDSPDVVLSLPSPDVDSQPQTEPAHQTPKKNKKPIPLVVHTPAVVKKQQSLYPEPKTARGVLEASVGPVQVNEMPSIHTFEWQLRTVMPPEVFAKEPEKRTDWTTVHSDYAHGAEAGLRQLYVQRTKSPLSTVVEVDDQSEEQSAEQATDQPAATAENKQTDRHPETPPDLDSDDIHSVRSESGPETPVAEAVKMALLDMSKLVDLDAIEGSIAEDSVISEHDA